MTDVGEVIGGVVESEECLFLMDALKVVGVSEKEGPARCLTEILPL